jgi:hypothetical protein
MTQTGELCWRRECFVHNGQLNELGNSTTVFRL